MFRCPPLSSRLCAAGGWVKGVRTQERKGGAPARVKSACWQRRHRSKLDSRQVFALGSAQRSAALGVLVRSFSVFMSRRLPSYSRPRVRGRPSAPPTARCWWLYRRSQVGDQVANASRTRVTHQPSSSAARSRVGWSVARDRLASLKPICASEPIHARSSAIGSSRRS
jgi:hypothetical protein